MKRILIIGAGGSGKTTLARRLAERTGLPLIHLDQLYWHSGWQATPTEEWRSKVDELIAGETWIMDGNAYTSRPGPRVVDGAERLQAMLTGRELPGLVRWRHPTRPLPFPPIQTS